MGRPPLLSTERFYLIARHLAEVLVEGSWDEDDLIERGRRLLGRRQGLLALARRLREALGAGSRPRAALVEKFLRTDADFRRACQRKVPRLDWRDRLPPVMRPAEGPPSSWPIPALTTPTLLAEWLGLTEPELEWFADCQARGVRRPAGPLRHYGYRWQTKSSGSARLIEAPKPRLKMVQRHLLDELLAGIPPHEAAHGFRPGRSVRSYVDPHVGRSVVLKMDLRDFFPSISASRVTALFLTAGYPERVARLLSGLCTNSIPLDIWADPGCPVHGPEQWRLARLYRTPHLPQGAPTSPALANLCVYRLDCRLAGLADSARARYTRYADDLAFSGGPELERSIDRFHIAACAIALEEGHVVQTRKTRVMRQGVRQRVAGVVLNGRPNVARPDYDALKATLHNCWKYGPEGQNRQGHADFRAHLRGRIDHVGTLNADRGRRLRVLFDRIAW